MLATLKTRTMHPLSLHCLCWTLRCRRLRRIWPSTRHSSIEADLGRAGAVLRFWELPRLAVVLGASRRLAEDVIGRKLPWPTRSPSPADPAEEGPC